MAKETNEEFFARTSKEHFDAPYMRPTNVSPTDAEKLKADALAYIAAHMGRISASLVRIEERLKSLEETQKKAD